MVQATGPSAVNRSRRPPLPGLLTGTDAAVPSPRPHRFVTPAPVRAPFTSAEASQATRERHVGKQACNRSP